MLISWEQLTPSNLIPLLELCQKYHAVSQSHAQNFLYRSSELAALAKEILPDSCHTRFTQSTAAAFSQYNAEKARLSSECEPPRHISFFYGDPLSLLLVNWRDSLFDGAGSPETYGFIDDDWIPGWDTWLAIVSLEDKTHTHALLCWVPPELCREVDSAISLDAASCMSWLAFNDSANPILVGWGRRWVPSTR